MSEENKNKTESIKQSETTSASIPSTEDFDVIFASKTDDGTIIDRRLTFDEYYAR